MPADREEMYVKPLQKLLNNEPPKLDGYIEYRRKRWRFIPKSKVFINKWTPPGDDAEFYENMPYGGRRSFLPVLKIKSSQLCHCFRARCIEDKWIYKISRDLKDFLGEKGIDIPNECGGILFKIEE